MTDILFQLNFVDFAILIVFMRICYIGYRMGLSVEIFKLLGVLFSAYFSLHYYTGLSDFIRKRFLTGEMPLEFMDFLVFLLLVCAGYLFFILLRSLLFRFIQLNAIPKINQIAGLMLAIARAYLVAGLIAYSLAICSISYLSGALKHSYLGTKAVSICPSVYSGIWNSVISKFSAHGKYNSTVEEALEKFNRNEAK